MKLSLFKRIIIFRQGQFGDTLVAFPIIEAISKQFPHIEIVYCTNQFKAENYVQGGDVAGLCPYISKVVTYNVEDSLNRKYKDLSEKLKVSKDDLLLYLPYSNVKRPQIIRDWIFFKALNFRNMKFFREYWRWTYEYEEARGNRNCRVPRETERMSNLIEHIGVELNLPEVCSIKCDEEWAEKKIEEWGLAEKKILAVCPGSKMQSKRWLLERFVEVGRQWHKFSGMSLVVLGGKEEEYLARELVRQWPGYGFSICGASIAQSAGFLKKVQGYLGNDTGSMHLSAVLGISCVAIFSSRAPAGLWYPYGDGHVVLRKDIECEGCNLYKCKDTPPLCLDKITVDEVFGALKKAHGVGGNT